MSRLRLSKVAAPANPPANALEHYYDQAAPGVGSTTKPVVIDESGNKVVLGGFATKDYRLIRVVTVLQGTTTFTPTNGAQALYVEAIGAGGSGGGGVTGTTATSAGSGGGGGAYSAKWVTGSLKTSYTVAVGAGGAAPAAGNNPGNVGGDTTFDSPSICTAKGGSGGAGGGVAGTALLVIAGGAGGAAASGVGDTAMGGDAGGYSLRASATVAATGRGGDCPLGGGGGGIEIVAQAAGSAGTGFGAGGSGGLSLNGGASVAGGAGANGLLRIWEFA